MTFTEFAMALGVVINTLPPIGEWKRFPTIDHPKKRNGSARFFGDHGHVCNFETGEDAHLWRPDSTEAPKIDHEAIRRVQEAEAQRIRQDQAKAAKKAGFILHNSRLDIHPYLKSKGFPEERAHIWEDDGLHKLAIPMRVNGALVGLQLIYQDKDADGELRFKEDGSPVFIKRFLTGQRTRDAAFIFDNQGITILAEGYCTCLSIRLAMKCLKIRYNLVCCFSASNLVRMSKALPAGIVVADNDITIVAPHTMPTGQRIAAEVGWPTMLPPVPGYDFNDWAREVGLFTSSRALGDVIKAFHLHQRVSRQSGLAIK